MTGLRTVVTKAGAQMAIVTVEDLQGTIEVVVFPRLYEQTRPAVDRRPDPADRRPHRPQGRGGLAARGPGRRLGRRGRAGSGGVRARGRRRRSGRTPAAAPVGAAGPGANGNGNGARAAAGGCGGGWRVPAPARRATDGLADPRRRRGAPAPLPPIAPPVPGPDLRGAGRGPRRRRPRHGAGRARRGARADPAPGGTSTRRSTPAGRGLHVRFARTPLPTGWSARWRPSRPCCATGRAQPAS